MAVTYSVFVEPDVHISRSQIPGNLRQRVRRLIEELGRTPRPQSSIALDVEGLALAPDIEVRRVRIDALRLIYVLVQI